MSDDQLIKLDILSKRLTDSLGTISLLMLEPKLNPTWICEMINAVKDSQDAFREFLRFINEILNHH